MRHGPRRAPGARPGASRRHRHLPRAAGRAAARPRGPAVPDGRAGAGRGLPAGAVHRRPDRGPQPRPGRGHGAAAPGAGRPSRPLPGGGLPGGAEGAAARGAQGRRGPADRAHPGAHPGPGGRMGRARRPGRRVGAAARRVRTARPVGPGGGGLRHGAGAQRAGHQRDPVRLRAGPAAADPGPDADHRGGRRQQHLAAPAVRRVDGRGRARAVPGAADDRAVGDPVLAAGEGDLGGDGGAPGTAGLPGDLAGLARFAGLVRSVSRSGGGGGRERRRAAPPVRGCGPRLRRRTAYLRIRLRSTYCMMPPLR
ncbi:hypothetical protein SGPA1_10919 [Streptomyces misionensis JCM 4497]